MSLSDADREELERVGPENVRSKLAYSGTGRGATVPGLGKGMMLRGDVEDWLAERVRESAKLEADTLFFTKAAFWIGGLGLLVAIIIAQFDRLGGWRRRVWPRLAAAGRGWGPAFSGNAAAFYPCSGWQRP